MRRAEPDSADGEETAWVSDITKNALANSLTELMAATPLDKITVRMLVENCGLNR